MRLRLIAICTFAALLTFSSCCKQKVYSAFLTMQFFGFSQNELNNLSFIGVSSSSEEMNIDFVGPALDNQIKIEFKEELEFSEVRILANDTTSIDTLFDVQSIRTNENNRCSNEYDVKLSLTYNKEAYLFEKSHVLTIIK